MCIVPYPLIVSICLHIIHSIICPLNQFLKECNICSWQDPIFLRQAADVKTPLHWSLEPNFLCNCRASNWWRTIGRLLRGGELHTPPPPTSAQLALFEDLCRNFDAPFLGNFDLRCKTLCSRLEEGEKTGLGFNSGPFIILIAAYLSTE